MLPEPRTNIADNPATREPMITLLQEIVVGGILPLHLVEVLHLELQEVQVAPQEVQDLPEVLEVLPEEAVAEEAAVVVDYNIIKLTKKPYSPFLCKVFFINHKYSS